MHHVVLERWSRGSSFLHRRDPRAKCLALLALLVGVGTAGKSVPLVALLYFMLLSAAILLARLPLAPVLMRAAVVLPFSLTFAAIAWLGGDAQRSLALLAKSYLSAVAVVVAVSTTPLPQLLRGLEMLRVPRFLLMVAQFLYRYLFVVSEEAQHVRAAAASRGATLRGAMAHRERFRAAAGALGLLFSRSYGRAESIHRAMLARGFQGHFQPLWPLRFGWADGAFLAAALLLAALCRLASEGWPA